MNSKVIQKKVNHGLPRAESKIHNYDGLTVISIRVQTHLINKQPQDWE